MEKVIIQKKSVAISAFTLDCVKNEIIFPSCTLKVFRGKVFDTITFFSYRHQYLLLHFTILIGRYLFIDLASIFVVWSLFSQASYCPSSVSVSISCYSYGSVFCHSIYMLILLYLLFFIWSTGLFLLPVRHLVIISSFYLICQYFVCYFS